MRRTKRWIVSESGTHELRRGLSPISGDLRKWRKVPSWSKPLEQAWRRQQVRSMVAVEIHELSDER